MERLDTRMLITKLKLDYFGHFHKKEITFRPGINLVYGENEAGKSTIHTFIKGMLFGIERMRGRGASSKDDIYNRYLPWDYPGAYHGSMDIMLGEDSYRLNRSFHAADKSFSVLDLKTGRDIILRDGDIKELIPALTESAYRNTVSIEQLKARTDASLAAEVRDYITNLSITKSKEVNITKAVNFLTDQKKQLEAMYLQLIQKQKTIQDDIDNETLAEEKIDNLSKQLNILKEEENHLKEQLQVAQRVIDKEEEEFIEELPAILVKYHSYQEILRQCSECEQKCRELEVKLAALDTSYETEESKDTTLTHDLTKAEQLTKEQMERYKNQSELKIKAAVDYKNALGKRVLYSILPFSVYILIYLILKGTKIIIGSGGIVFGIGTILSLAAGGVIFGMLNQRQKKLQKQYKVDLIEASKQITKITEILQGIFTRYSVSSIEELSRKKDDIRKNWYELEYTKKQIEELKVRLSKLEDDKDILYDVVMTYMQHFIQEDELSESSVNRLKERVESIKKERRDKLAAIANLCETNRLSIEKLKWEISAMEGNEEKLLRHKEDLTELDQKQDDIEKELEAVKLALNTINELSVDIHDNFGLKLNQAVSDIVKEVTEGKYTDIKIDEKLDLKASCKGTYLPFDRLSSGTIEQIYFALRLAVADLLLEKERMPLLLDDSFALYDDQRVKAVLKKLTSRNQTIIFSCHNREQQLLDELKIPYHYIPL